MPQTFLLTNRLNLAEDIQGFSKIKRETNFAFWTQETFLKDYGDCSIYINGHVSPRQKILQEAKGRKQHDLIFYLIGEFGDGFINYIKGNFIVIVVYNNAFKIYCDHFAVRKFIIWQKDNKFIISDDLKAIARITPLTLSATSMANYAIDYHFTEGTTAFENVWHNQPGQIFELSKTGLESNNFWHPSKLLTLKKRNIPIGDISDMLSAAVDSGLQHMGTQSISLSLTGGADTRNLLSLFLSKGLKPHLYTYGNPASNDGVKAAAIAKGLGLEHTIHDIQMTPSLFEEYGRKITRLSGGLASIHRAHRLIAVEKEKEYANQMFLGTLGGEFIKGVSEDNYIDPAVVYENWERNSYTTPWLEDYLIPKGINPNAIDLHKLIALVEQKPYMIGSVVQRKHNSLSFITAHLHDAQDINLYRSAMDEVYTPFLDIDYLELIFSSQYSFDNKEKVKNKLLKRIENPVYSSRFLKSTYPPLLKYPYAGDHKPSEVLLNKYYAALVKKIRQSSKLVAYPPNFPLSKWMQEFVEKHLPSCNDYHDIKTTFNIDGLMQDLRSGNHQPKESYWLKYTNPILMKFIYDEFKTS